MPETFYLAGRADPEKDGIRHRTILKTLRAPFQVPFLFSTAAEAIRRFPACHKQKRNVIPLRNVITYRHSMSRVSFSTSLIGGSALLRIMFALGVMAVLWLAIYWAISLP